MNQPDADNISDVAADRLVTAATGMWRTHGRAEMSARQVSQAASAQASQINYYFGGLERLLCSSQGVAISAARVWCAGILDEFRGLGLSSGDAAPAGQVIASVIDAWCHDQADLAFAWTECQMLAPRHPDYAQAAAQWREVWSAFWSQACEQLGLAPHTELTLAFFTGEAFLHRIVWRAPFDRACLSETCAAWTNLLARGDCGPAPLRDFARTETRRFAAPVLVAGSAPARLAEAAADLIGQAGPAAVTHRAVAQAAGLNLGAATYHFPTRMALMTAAWDHIYLRLLRPHQATETGPLDRETYIESLVTYGGGEAQRPDVLAMEALLSQAARDKGLRNMGAMIRYSRGQSSHLRLARLPRARGALNPQASALFSTVAQGLGRDLSAVPLEQRPALARQTFTQLLDVAGVD